MEDSSPEAIGAIESTLTLKTNALKCKVCLVGDVVPDLKNNKADNFFMVYTRGGTKKAKHLNYRYP